MSHSVQDILERLRALGSETIRNIYAKHGIGEPCYGVKVADLKTVLKSIKNDQALSLALYDSGVYEAMYLAGLSVNGAKMRLEELQHWADQAPNTSIAEYTVAWAAHEHPQAWNLALRWIDSDRELTSIAGWSTAACVLGTRADTALDLASAEQLLDRVAAEIHSAPNRLRYVMNNYLIAAGCALTSLTEKALLLAARIGKVSVDMGDTACKVPSAAAYIEKVRQKGLLGKKRKTAKC